jgi:hypothetical protein
MFTADWSKRFVDLAEFDAEMGFRLPFSRGESWVETGTDTLYVKIIPLSEGGGVRCWCWNKTSIRSELGAALGLPVYRIN